MRPISTGRYPPAPMAWARVGMPESRTWLLVHTRFSKGWRPVRADMRDGTHRGEGQ